MRAAPDPHPLRPRAFRLAWPRRYKGGWDGDGAETVEARSLADAGWIAAKLRRWSNPKWEWHPDRLEGRQGAAGVIVTEAPET